MERTLFLNERTGMSVRRDGPSLWIERPGAAGSRVPLRLIRRVLISGNVALDAESLTTFARRGVPIMFARRGLQAGALEHSGVRERLSAWLSAWERGRRLALATRLDPVTALQWRRQGVRAEDYESWIHRQRRLRGLSLRRRAVFHATADTLALDRITDAGWDPHLGVAHRGEPLGFVKDCAMAIRADADRIWLESGTLAGGTGSALSEDVAAFFEQQRPRLTRLLTRLLEQYAELLREP
jgi:CRISPR/Cas system-associated endonuclease Cas1